MASGSPESRILVPFLFAHPLPREHERNYSHTTCGVLSPYHSSATTRQPDAHAAERPAELLAPGVRHRPHAGHVTIQPKRKGGCHRQLFNLFVRNLSFQPEILHELEVELARPDYLLSTAYKRGDPNVSEAERSAFNELIRAFVNNARILVRNAPPDGWQ